MKNFIYLDTSFLHSFLAQKLDGLPTSKNTEHLEQESKTSQDGTIRDLTNGLSVEGSTGSFDIGVLKAPSAKGSYTLTHRSSHSRSISWSQLDAGKEIISKQLHDNALSEFESFALEKGILKNENDHLTPGDYIKVSGSFKVVDINYFSEILSEEFVELAVKMAVETQKEIAIAGIEYEPMTTQDKKTRKKEITSMYDQQINTTRKQLEIFRRMFGYVSSILGTESFLRLGNFVAPLKPDFMRESSKEMIFKHGANDTNLSVTLMGKITRRHENTAPRNADIDGFLQAIGFLSGLIDNLIIDTKLIQIGDYIVSPVAIYFEEFAGF